MSKKVFKFLSVTGLQTLVGSSADKDVIYSADYDLMEQKKFKRDYAVYNFILNLFRKKYKLALKPKSNIWIIDFKCGSFRGQPIRWDKESIKKGYVVINDEPKYFVDCLQQESRIKMDVIALDNDGKLNEYSDLYFINIGEFSLSGVMETEKQSAISIFKDFQNYILEKNYFKAIKRLYAYAKLENNKPLIHELLKVINSPLGKQSKYIADINIVLELMDNNFKRFKKKLIFDNLALLNIKIAKSKSLDAIAKTLKELVAKYSNELNNKVVEVVNKNKLLNSFFHFE
jgi:hypothetical protein